MFFNSRRSPVLAQNGMCATSQPLAAQVGLQTLVNGGNAVDAAVACAAVLNVVEPISTGVGGDMFALIWDAKKKKMYALNGSGAAPLSSSIDELLSQGHKRVPEFGVYSVSTPGTVHGWETILGSFGSMTLSEVLKPAIKYAEEGFPVTEIISHQWRQVEDKISRLPSGQEMLINGRAPQHGETMTIPTLGRTLRTISEGGSEAFYKGEIAGKIAAFVQEQGGWLSNEDLQIHSSDWDEPISTDYRGVTCWECPPNGQGIAALEALNIIEGFDMPQMGAQSSERYHHLIEAMRLAFADGFKYIADPRKSTVPIEQLASKSYADQRRQLINSNTAMKSVPYGQMLEGSDTVYISCIDNEGNACSFINSVFSNFGSGLVVPGTGIVLHNRASLFSLEPDHPNSLTGGKRPYHTIIPAMATQNGDLTLCYGVMGGFMQPQGHLQMINNMVDLNMNPQESIDALRFQVVGEGVVLEEGVDQSVVKELQSMGHTVNLMAGPQRGGSGGMGGAQIIYRDPNTGVLWGGSESRKDGCAVGW